jgi:hypothetical protein
MGDMVGPMAKACKAFSIMLTKETDIIFSFNAL